MIFYVRTTLYGSILPTEYCCRRLRVPFNKDDELDVTKKITDIFVVDYAAATAAAVEFVQYGK